MTRRDVPTPQQYAPSGPDGTGEKTLPAGPGGTSEEDLDTELTAAREAGEYAAAVAGVDASAAAPIPRDADEVLRTPGTGSSAPADSDPKRLDRDSLVRGADQGN